MRAVRCREFDRTWRSIAACSREVDICAGSITHSCRTGRSVRGLTFKFHHPELAKTERDEAMAESAEVARRLRGIDEDSGFYEVWYDEIFAAVMGRHPDARFLYRAEEGRRRRGALRARQPVHARDSAPPVQADGPLAGRHT